MSAVALIFVTGIVALSAGYVIYRLNKPTLRLQQFDRVRACYSPRRKDAEAAGLTDRIGQVSVFMAAWVIDEGPFAGQWAFMMPHSWTPEPTWVPEGDLHVIDRLPFDAPDWPHSL